MTSAGAAEFTTVLAQRPILSAEIPRRLEDTVNHRVKAASTRAPSAATTMADRRGAIPHAEAPAWVAEEDFMAAVAEEDFTAAVAVTGNRVSLSGSL